MKKLILKLLTIVGSMATIAGGGYGLLWLFGKALGEKLTDEYASEHPVKSYIWCVSGMLIIVALPFYLLWSIVWGIQERLEKKIDGMRDDKHIEMTTETKEDKEWQ